MTVCPIKAEAAGAVRVSRCTFPAQKTKPYDEVRFGDRRCGEWARQRRHSQQHRRRSQSLWPSRHLHQNRFSLSLYPFLFLSIFFHKILLILVQIHEMKSNNKTLACTWTCVFHSSFNGVLRLITTYFFWQQFADPYLNTDAGTMSPFEHGEVFVLDDGGEVLDPLPFSFVQY